MIAKFSVKRPYTVVVGMVLVLGFVSFKDENRSPAGYDPALCPCVYYLHRRQPGRGGDDSYQAGGAVYGDHQQH